MIYEVDGALATYGMLSKG